MNYIKVIRKRNLMDIGVTMKNSFVEDKKKKNSTREINTRIRFMFSDCKNLKIGRRSCFENEGNFPRIIIISRI